MTKLVAFTAAVGIVFILTGCFNKKEYFEDSGTVFHTLYHIKYESHELLTEKIDAELQQFNLSLNPFKPNSIISKVNNNEPVEVDPWFKECLPSHWKYQLLQTESLISLVRRWSTCGDSVLTKWIA